MTGRTIAGRSSRQVRTCLAGLLTFGSVAGASIASGAVLSPAAAATSPAWTAYAVSYNDSAVIPVNTATDAVGTPIAAGSGASAIAITPDGSTAYVTDEGFTNSAPGAVTPIALATNTPGTPIAVGSGPDAIAITPDGLTAYVGNYNDSTITPINLVSRAALAAIPVGGQPTAISIAPDGTTAYVSRAFQAGTQINLATNSVGPAPSPSGSSSAITPDGTTLFVPNPSTNNVALFNPATNTGTTVAALNFPQGVAVTPDGSTAYVAYRTFADNKPKLLPIPTADPQNTGTPIVLGTTAAEAVAITPDGARAFVTDPLAGTVTRVDLASGTAGTPISLGSSGTNPVAIAIVPDQAPKAHLHVTLAPIGSPSTFNASTSTVPLGTIASYAWDFGDGTQAITSTPVTTHTYSGGSYTASVTETSSGGTSTAQVFTGQTASHNGSSRATAAALGSLAGGGPIVASVSPDIGSTAGPTIVTISGTGFTGVSAVDVGGVAASNVTFNSDGSVMATLPAQSASVNDVIVTTPIGSSATTPADQFTYEASVPPVSLTCQTSACPIPIVQFPVAQGGSTSVSSIVSSDCNVCKFSESASYGLPPACDGAGGGCCPSGMSYEQAEISVGEANAQSSSPLDVLTEQIVQGQAASAGGLPFPPPPVPQTTVCAEAQKLSGGSSGSGGIDQKASAASGLGRNILVRKCAQPAVAPCVKSVVVKGRTVVTTVILPVNESITLTVGPKKEVLGGATPAMGAPGSKVTIQGTSLTEVNKVVIGGVQASIVSEKAKRLVVIIPAGAISGPITAIGPSGEVTSSWSFTVT